MLGWSTWKAAKGIAKYHKAKKSIPNPRAKKTSKKKKAGRVIAGAAAAAGVTAMIKRKRKHKHGGDYHAPDSSSE
jgi:hypothetical protein